MIHNLDIEGEYEGVLLSKGIEIFIGEIDDVKRDTYVEKITKLDATKESLIQFLREVLTPRNDNIYELEDLSLEDLTILLSKVSDRLW